MRELPRVKYPPVDPRDYGARMDGTTDDATALAAAISTLGTHARRRIALPPTQEGVMKIASTIQIETKNLVFEGEGFNDASVTADAITGGYRGGSKISYTGTGPLFQLHTDSGNPWDTVSEYNGVQGFVMKDIMLSYDGTTATALNNGQANYRTGTYGIRDWRGGDIYLERVHFRKFNYGFWGIQSDLNHFYDCEFYWNKVGMFVGPRSDQFASSGCQWALNDVAMQFDGVRGARIRDGQVIANGSTTDHPIVVGASLAYFSWGVTFDGMWLEETGPVNGHIPAFIAVGMANDGTLDTYMTNDLRVLNSYVSIDTQASNFAIDHLVRIGYADDITVRGISGYATNFIKLIRSDAATHNPTITVDARDDQRISGSWVFDNGAGTPLVISRSQASARHQLRSQSGRLFVGREDPNVERDFYITSDNDFSFSVGVPGTTVGGSTTLLSIRKRIHDGTAAPTTGTWAVGDTVRNMAPAEAGGAGSKYVVTGWICTVAGTPGTWLELRALTGN